MNKIIKDLAIRLNVCNVYNIETFSMTELYYAVIKKVNDLIEELNRFSGEVDSGFNELSETITNELSTQTEKLDFLLNDGLREKVLEKLNEWLDDGTMDSLINITGLNTVNEKIKIHNSKETELLSLALQKLSRGEKLTIVCQGDSMTYGQDNNSSDRRGASLDLCDDGSSHSQERAGVTYPEAFKSYLDKIYPNLNHTVINKGYSGDWAEKGYERWNSNSNADIVFIMYGSNDSNLSASWVPSNVLGNLSNYIGNMRKIVERYLKWGTAVVLLTPPRSLNVENGKTGRIAESYRQSLNMIGKEYNIPVIDAESFSNGWDNSFYSDTTHFNSKGYQAFASRLITVLIGNTLIETNKLYTGEFIGIRPTRDNITLGNTATLDHSDSSLGQIEGLTGKGLVILPKTSITSFAFETVEDDVIIIPVFGCFGNSLTYELDFNNPQGNSIAQFTNFLWNETLTEKITTPSSFSALTYKDYYSYLTYAYNNKLYFNVKNKGLHNISVYSDGNNSAINGFISLSKIDFYYIINSKVGKQGFYYDKTHTSFGSSTTVTSTSIPLVNIMARLSHENIIDSTEYWKNPVMKLTVTNYSQSIIEYYFIIGSTKDGNNMRFLGEVNRKNIASSPVERTVTNITFNSSNQSLVITWGGDTTRATNFTISVV